MNRRVALEAGFRPWQQAAPVAWDVSLALLTTFSSVPASFDRLGFET